MMSFDLLPRRCDYYFATMERIGKGQVTQIEKNW